jgi:hypothetical protein
MSNLVETIMDEMCAVIAQHVKDDNDSIIHVTNAISTASTKLNKSFDKPVVLEGKRKRPFDELSIDIKRDTVTFVLKRYTDLYEQTKEEKHLVELRRFLEAL